MFLFLFIFKNFLWSWIINVFYTFLKLVYRNKVINPWYLQHKGKYGGIFGRFAYESHLNARFVIKTSVNWACRYRSGQKSGRFWSIRLDQLMLIFTKVMLTSWKNCGDMSKGKNDADTALLETYSTFELFHNWADMDNFDSWNHYPIWLPFFQHKIGSKFNSNCEKSHDVQFNSDIPLLGQISAKFTKKRKRTNKTISGKIPVELSVSPN